jgi:small conductance mechanosensitive channel
MPRCAAIDITRLRRSAAVAIVLSLSRSAAAQPPSDLAGSPAGGKASRIDSDHVQIRLPTWVEIQTWIMDHGVAILVIVAVVLLILWVSQLLAGRVVGLLAGNADPLTRLERENRAKTLVSVLHNALRTTAITIGVIMVLEEFSVPIGPLLGGVAVIGLAVAFGAQSLIKDYFTGFMVLLEQQYLIGDVVQIGEITGQVERITLRLTVLRDYEGRAHFIPHGQITVVTNLTHGWSRAVFEIGIGYQQDVEQVIEVLLDLARELRRDVKFADMIVADPEMQGVDALGESAVVIKFGLKTRPMKQWDVKRELLRRIKRRFDELGIEIPYPQRTLWVRRQPRVGDQGPAAESQEPNPKPLI